MKLDGKVAVITGASQGMGKAIATRLATEGASVVIDYVGDAGPANDLVSKLRGDGFKAHAVKADVSQAVECQSLMAEAVRTFGRLDILASNAGVEHFGKLDEITEADFQRVFSVNVAGQLYATQAACRHLTSGGRIVLTSSLSARTPVFHHTLYAASKAAVSAMALNLAPELGERGITINAVAPGGTATNMAKEYGKFYTNPALRDVPPDLLVKAKSSLQRMAQPEEIAAVVAFLASADASYITGTTVAVDGGAL